MHIGLFISRSIFSYRKFFCILGETPKSILPMRKLCQQSIVIRVKKQSQQHSFQKTNQKKTGIRMNVNAVTELSVGKQEITDQKCVLNIRVVNVKIVENN